MVLSVSVLEGLKVKKCDTVFLMHQHTCLMLKKRYIFKIKMCNVKLHSFSHWLNVKFSVGFLFIYF